MEVSEDALNLLQRATKGFGDLGYVLKDERVIKEARKWIEAKTKCQPEAQRNGLRVKSRSTQMPPLLFMPSHQMESRRR